MQDLWSNTLLKQPQLFANQTAVGLFRMAVSHNPDKTAVSAVDGSLTYAQLEEKSNRLARAFAAQNAQVGDVIAIKTGRSAKTLVAILAAWKAGCAVPKQPKCILYGAVSCSDSGDGGDD